MTRHQRARSLKKKEISNKKITKPTSSQVPRSSSHYNKRPILTSKYFNNQRGLLPTPNLKPLYQSNQRYSEPSFQNKTNFQNNSYFTLSRYGIEQLYILLQDPRVFNLGFLCANHGGPKKQWVPKA